MPDFIDCNCSVGDKCPQGKVGSRTRCFIPVERATVGNKPVFEVVTPLTPTTVEPPAGEALMCKGAWELGTACGNCSRCIKSALEGYPAMLRDVRTATERLDALGDILRVGGHGFDASDKFKLAAFEEARRLVMEPDAKRAAPNRTWTAIRPRCHALSSGRTRADTWARLPSPMR